MITSRLYAWHWNTNGAADRFIHVRLQQPGREHTSPRSYDSIEAGDCSPFSHEIDEKGLR